VDAAGTMQHTFLLARVEPGLAAVAPIPIDEVENKYRFARYVEATEGKRILSGPTSPVTTCYVTEGCRAAERVGHEPVVAGLSQSEFFECRMFSLERSRKPLLCPTPPPPSAP
jgi:hypothetical protein